jgi:fucose 4-O-acetylase-like acetyltransferase
MGKMEGSSLEALGRLE